ncbi:Fic family protein [Sporosarcina siberiensis]|uniref:Fic family protein n=1 Tax=Sporosarcina siberiensis TaxID=1365606 RepID=A0ABW4SJV1_9BACL
MEILLELTQLKEKLDKQRPLPTITIQKLQQDFLIKSTYHSNAIEGNTLTVYETKAILEDGITVSGKSLREHLEAINHRDAILFVEDILHESINERLIKDIHQLVLRGIDLQNAGIYRMHEVIITGASHDVTPAFKINDQMESLIDWHNTVNDLHPIEKACMLHSKFVNIHPFIDGNGRTARLLMNLELLRNGYLPAIIHVEERQAYYEALDIAATTKEYTKLVKLVAEREKEQLLRYLSLITKE